MAVSRPFVLALLGVLLLAATFTSLRSAADRAQADEAVTAPQVIKPAAKPSPQQGQSASKPAEKPKEKKAGAVDGVPPSVGKALAARRIVVLLFTQPAADDDASAAAVRSLRGVKGVSVFRAPISKLARYRRVVSSLGVTQAPAIVIVDKDRKARLIEGFVDEGTLRQQVRDAR